MQIRGVEEGQLNLPARECAGGRRNVTPITDTDCQVADVARVSVRDKYPAGRCETVVMSGLGLSKVVEQTVELPPSQARDL